MSSRESALSLSIISTDSYPSLYKSFSSKPSSSSTNTTVSSKSSSSSASTPASTILNKPYRETTCSTVPPRLKWNREVPAINRPYDFRKFDAPFKSLPTYLSQLGGLGIPARKPCHSPKPDPFHKRTHVDEIFHKRVTDASAFSITEQPRTDVCLKQKPPEVSEVTLKVVKSVVLADNVHSVEDDSSDSELDEGLSEMSWHAFQERPKRDDVLKECKRSFFQARKELFKLRQYDDYLEAKNRQPVELESWEISSESTVETVEEDLEFQPAVEEIVVEPSESIDEYQLTEIVHVEDKANVQKHEQSYMERVREHMWKQYEREELEQQEAQEERERSPEPLEEEEILKTVPEQDYLNKQKHLFRQELAERLEEIERSIKREPKKLPQTTVQFEKYTDELMGARRKLIDEAILVDEHYKKGGLKHYVPELDLQLRKYRAADYRSDEEGSNDAEDEALDAPEEPVVHTCMTRLEWARWMGRCTKLERLKLPKVKIPRLPKMIHTAEQSPIRMYIKGLHREDKRKKPEQEQSLPSSSSSVAMVKDSEPELVKWHLKELLYDKPKEYRISAFVPYKPPIRPFPELAKDRYKLKQAERRKRRDRRMNHMTWINQLVEEICNRNYL